MADIAVVIPVFDEEGIVEELVARLAKMADGQPHRFEFVIVDDGSRDATANKLAALQASEPRLTVISLSRNWGHQNAINAGLDYAGACDAVVLMDGDLEDPPEVIPQLIEQWEQGHQVVYTVKQSRVDSRLRLALFEIYYRLIQYATASRLERNAGVFSLLDARAAAQLRRFMERNKSYPNLRAFIGFRQTRVAYDRDKRFAGRPKQTLSRLINDGLNALFSFSSLPLRALTVLGLTMTVVFSLLTVFFFVLRVTGWEFWIFFQLPGWTSFVMLLLVFASLNMLFLGVIGEYVRLIFDEVTSRPYYIVDAVHPARDRAVKDPDGDK